MNPWDMIVELENMKITRDIMRDYSDPSKQAAVQAQAEASRDKRMLKMIKDLKADDVNLTTAEAGEIAKMLIG